MRWGNCEKVKPLQLARELFAYSTWSPPLLFGSAIFNSRFLDFQKEFSRWQKKKKKLILFECKEDNCFPYSPTSRKIDPPLTRLFNSSHLVFRTYTDVLVFLIYIPFGMLLLTIRLYWFFTLGKLLLSDFNWNVIIIGLILLISPNFYFPVWLNRLLFPLFGLLVHVDSKHLSKDSKIIACNHVTAFDVFPFLLASRISVLVDKGFFESNFFAKQFTKICGAFPIDRDDARNNPGSLFIIFRNNWRRT